MTLRLPRHPPSVVIARHVARHLLEALDTARQVIEDLELGVGEACANAVQHGWRGQAYVVSITVEGATCTVWVVDDGPGFDLERLPPTHPTAESGRGLSLMRAVMDTIQVVSQPGEGTVVRLVKRLDPGP